MKIQIENLKKVDIDSIDGDIYVNDTDGVQRKILESQYLAPLSGRNAPAHEPTDLFIDGSYREIHRKLLNFGLVPVPSPVCLGCGAANDHHNLPDDRYCFECVDKGETPCRSPNCDKDGYRDDVNHVTMNYCKECAERSEV